MFLCGFVKPRAPHPQKKTQEAMDKTGSIHQSFSARQRGTASQGFAAASTSPPTVASTPSSASPAAAPRRRRIASPIASSRRRHPVAVVSLPLLASYRRRIASSILCFRTSPLPRCRLYPGGPRPRRASRKLFKHVASQSFSARAVFLCQLLSSPPRRQPVRRGGRGDT